MWDVWGCLHSVPDCLPTPEAVLRDLLYLLAFAYRLEFRGLYLNGKLSHSVSLHFIYGCPYNDFWSLYIRITIYHLYILYIMIIIYQNVSNCLPVRWNIICHNLLLVRYPTMGLLNWRLLVYLKCNESYLHPCYQLSCSTPIVYIRKYCCTEKCKNYTLK